MRSRKTRPPVRMVGAEATNQQEATDGQCLARAGPDQGRPGAVPFGGVDRGGLPRGGAQVAGAEAGAGGDAAPVRAAGAALQHGDPAPAAPGREAGERRGVLQGADAAAAGGGAGAAEEK